MEPLIEGDGQLHTITYPARMLGFSLNDPKAGSDAYVMAVADDGSPAGKPVLVAGGPGEQASPAVSADGTLVAYQSTESGRDEIYVARLADLSNRRRVTNDGGDSPQWNRSGNRLFYGSKNIVYATALRSASELLLRRAAGGDRRSRPRARSSASTSRRTEPRCSSGAWPTP